MRNIFSIIVLLFMGWSNNISCQEKWAVIIGISKYAQLGNQFPVLPYAREDAQNIATSLTSNYSRFSVDRISCLTDQNATGHAVRNLFSEYLSRTAENDTVIFFFIGHGLRDPFSNRFYLMCYDSNPNSLATTAISLEQVADFLQAYVPARHIMICLDARRSPQSLGSSWYTSKAWALGVKQKQFCVLESCSPNEIAKDREGKGIFADFWSRALQGNYCLGQDPDQNGDGLITVTEMAEYLCLAIEFSTTLQHPIFWGKVDAVVSLSSLQPHIQIAVPKIFRSQEQAEWQIAGFIRHEQPIDTVKISQVKARLGLLSPEEIKRYQIFPWHHTYWFSVRLNVAPDAPKLDAEITCNGQIINREVELAWSHRGWYGEWMPPGLTKGKLKGIYLWTCDQSEMVYIPGGPCIIGVSPEQRAQLTTQLKELLSYMMEQKEWLASDYHLRQVIINGLEESNQTLRGIAEKLKIIYAQVEAFQSVNNRLVTAGKKKKEEDESPIPTISEPTNPADSVLKERLFITLSEDLILRCYRDVRAVMLKQRELDTTIGYLQVLSSTNAPGASHLAKRSVELPPFYIDRYEITNQQYQKFCKATSRPYPPSPWWNEEYFFAFPGHPVVNISWQDAMAYAYWCGKILPSSWEWEKTARGETGLIYPWGNEEPNQNYVNADVPPDPSKDTLELPLLSPVSAWVTNYPASPYGCYHLAGNVREWCLDSPKDIADNVSEEYRIAKGGSFESSSVMLCSWFEQPFAISTRRCDLGFRCALKPASEE